MNRYIEKAQVLSPPQVVEKHRQAADTLQSLYHNSSHSTQNGFFPSPASCTNAPAERLYD
ncbi:hypothetical protein [Iningainema tapete]|uniref:hypothetical protein n=1 Tax=Iningainema tapete TaxID=2806730 RepID=UPI001EE226DC|nr:hypothetical protein [Iningainema tapete]